MELTVFGSRLILILASCIRIPMFQISQILLYIHWDTATGKISNGKNLF